MIDPNSDLHRRAMLAGAGTLAFAGAAPTASAAGAPLFPPPTLQFVFEQEVQVGPVQSLGAGPLGERRMIAILGGAFQGPRIRGVVLPGADRQLVRKTGLRQLSALYELRTDDGVVISVEDRALADFTDPAKPRVFSTVDLAAPEGPHDWLNRLVFVSQLHPDAAHSRVRIQVYALT